MKTFFLVLLLQQFFSLTNGQICDTEITSWDDLLQQIENNYGFVFLCPFEISGSECPNEPYTIPENHHVELICETSHDIRNPCANSLCTIDCPNTHFEIEHGGSLVLDGVRLSGSEDTAVRVKEGGFLVTYCSIFENNRNEFNNGGAIFAYQQSRVRLIDTHFRNNKGLNGGAIYHQGIIYLDGSNFEENVAEMGGGAMYTGPDGTSTMMMNTFAFNHANLFGPAVFDAGITTTQQRNIGCQNTGSSINCDGVSALIGGRELCNTFVEREAWCQTRISMRNAARSNNNNNDSTQQNNNNNNYGAAHNRNLLSSSSNTSNNKNNGNIRKL